MLPMRVNLEVASFYFIIISILVGRKNDERRSRRHFHACYFVLSVDGAAVAISTEAVGFCLPYRIDRWRQCLIKRVSQKLEVIERGLFVFCMSRYSIGRFRRGGASVPNFYL